MFYNLRALKKKAKVNHPNAIFDGLRDLFAATAGAEYPVGTADVMGHKANEEIVKYAGRLVTETDKVVAKVEKRYLRIRFLYIR